MSLSGFLLLLSVLSVSLPARAALGEHESAIEADRNRIKGHRNAALRYEAYKVLEITNDEGITLREYVGDDGRVFAVAWDSITQPDLSAILGTYFHEFQAAHRSAARVRGIRSGRVIQSDSVVVERSGHLRGAKGKAYLPASLPKGVSANEIN